MMMNTWSNDLTSPLKVMPARIWKRGMGEASISFIRPHILSSCSEMPPYIVVNRMVIATTPASMNVR